MMSTIYQQAGLRTPYFVVHEDLLETNLKILKQVSESAGCKILLAQKAFSMFYAYPLIRRYLCGTTASGLYEARLGKQDFGGETHVFSPAYREDEWQELLTYADHMVFNSVHQLKLFGPSARAANKSVGLRINPECSTQQGHEIYDPCGPGSRLGTTKAQFDPEVLPLLDGLHFHTLCEQNSHDLVTTFRAFERQFGTYLHHMKWLNLGGGHHITKQDYDRQTLIDLIREIKATYGVEVYLEPGEAVVLDAGFLVSSVLDLVENQITTAILDTSAACHMPDVLEMPYRPPVTAGGKAGEKPFTYRLAGPTCLAGDVIGDYSFDKALVPGDLVVFEDMALYTMVKTNTFNGMSLPAIAWADKEGKITLIREFSYEDFRSRLS